jgi:YHS domain-containing protein
MASTGSILWITAIGALFYYMMRKGGGRCCGGHGQEDYRQNGHKDHEMKSEHTARQKMIEDEKSHESAELRDPVCGMKVSRGPATLVSDHFGRTFHFCSEQCRKLFDINPNRYIGSV